MNYDMCEDISIQLAVEESIKEIEQRFNIDIQLRDWTWSNTRQLKEKCLQIINKKGVLDYEEIYKFLTYLKNNTDLVGHIYYVEYGLQKSQHTSIQTDMITLMEEMYKYCDYPEAQEGFLTDLTIGCAKNNVDAVDGFIFWNARTQGANYFENNEQLTKRITRWIENDDTFCDENETEIIDELYEILTCGGE